MPLKIPPELKKITQYIRRAEELDRDTSPHTRLVAYYCRQHAVQLGIPFATTPPTRDCLSSILNDLEKEIKAKSNFSKDEAYIVCRDFAFKVFDKADAIDRAGKSDKNTAKSFYAAASFLDVLSYFHPSKDGEEKSEDVIEEEKKSFYAKWKATDILKAIREGREIQPGGFGETTAGVEQDDSSSKQDEEVDTGGAMPPPPPYPAASAPPSAPVVPTDVARPVPVPAPSSGFMSFFGGSKTVESSKYSKDVLNDAKELTNFALTALNEKDGDLAMQRLREALEVLNEASLQS